MTVVDSPTGVDPSAIIRTQNQPLAAPLPSNRYEGFDLSDLVPPMVHFYHGTPEEEEKFGKGFERADLINTLTGQKLTSRKFVPIRGWREFMAFEGNMILWRTKNEAEARQKLKSNPPSNRDAGRDPADLFGHRFYNFIVFFEEEPGPLLLSFSKTAEKAGRALVTNEQQYRPAGSPGLYSLESEKAVSTGRGTNGVVDQSKAGKNYLRPAIRPQGNPSPELMAKVIEAFNRIAGIDLSAADQLAADASDLINENKSSGSSGGGFNPDEDPPI